VGVVCVRVSEHQLTAQERISKVPGDVVGTFLLLIITTEAGVTLMAGVLTIAPSTETNPWWAQQRTTQAGKRKKVSAGCRARVM
jgi:hypothetical protein